MKAHFVSAKTVITFKLEDDVELGEAWAILGPGKDPEIILPSLPPDKAEIAQIIIKQWLEATKQLFQ